MRTPIGAVPGSTPPGYRQAVPAARDSMSPPPSYGNGLSDLADALDGLGDRTIGHTSAEPAPTISKKDAEALWEKVIKLFRPILANNSSGLRDYFSKLGFSDTQALDHVESLFNAIVEHERPLGGALSLPTQMPDDFPKYANAATQSGVFGSDPGTVLDDANRRQDEIQASQIPRPPIHGMDTRD